MYTSTFLRLAAIASVASAQSLVSLLQNTTELSSLFSLLQGYPDLVNTLSGASNVTVFAPNNAALAAAGAALTAANSTLPNFVPNLIEYHVLKSSVYASQIGRTPVFAHTLQNNTAYSNVTNGQVVEARAATNGSVYLTSGLKNRAEVVTANVNFTGGVVHIIDSVLTIPPKISTTASDAGLSAFAGALNLAGLTNAVDGLKDITVFAPSNAAFQNIGSALGNLSSAALTSILTYHVINGTIAYSPSLGNVSIPTLGGGRVNITVSPAGQVYVNQARVINPDILVANGVVHVIDNVLNPNGTVSAGNGTNAFPGASSVSNLGALTSSLPAATTTVVALTSTTDNVASGYTGTQAPGGTATSQISTTSSPGAAAPMATAAVAGAMVVGGWAALLAQM